MADFEQVIRRRQIVLELEKRLLATDFPDLTSKRDDARSGENTEALVLPKTLIDRATEFAIVSAQLSEVSPLETAMVFVRFAVELAPTNAEIIRDAGEFFLRPPPEAGLIYEAENLLEYSVSLHQKDRVVRIDWLKSLAQLSRFDAAERQQKSLWPPQPGEARL